MGPVISVFVMVLIVSILAGLTFLFISQLKTNVSDQTATASGSAYDEVGFINSSGYTLSNSTRLGARSFTITSIRNVTAGVIITSGNYTLTGAVLTNATAVTWEGAGVYINYTYDYISERTAFDSVNSTEAAGASLVNYLSLIFLAVIFGAILTLVLKIILPYINLGRNIDGF